MSYPYLSDYLNSLFGTQLHIPIATFGSFVAIAILLASYVAKIEVKRFENIGILPKATHELIADLAVISVMFGILGARIFHILEYPSEFLENPYEMVFSQAGLSVYGGFTFGVIAGAIYLRRKSIPLIPVLDALAPSMALGYGIGRIGCQISGDGDWGIMANMSIKPDWFPEWLWAQTYENNIAGITIPEPGAYPTPIYETVTALLIFVALWLFRKSAYSMGFAISVYLLLSGFARLLVEKIRINSEYQIFGFSFTQAEFISTVLIIVGLLGILKVAQIKNYSKVVFSITVVGALSACSSL